MTVIQILNSLVRAAECAPDDEFVDLLRHAPPAIHHLLDFCYGPHEIALPTTDIPYKPHEGEPRSDILALDAHRLKRLFVRDENPALSSAKRVDLWKQILERATPPEVALLESIRRFRHMPIRRSLWERACFRAP